MFPLQSVEIHILALVTSVTSQAAPAWWASPQHPFASEKPGSKWPEITPSVWWTQSRVSDNLIKTCSKNLKNHHLLTIILQALGPYQHISISFVLSSDIYISTYFDFLYLSIATASLCKSLSNFCHTNSHRQNQIVRHQGTVVQVRQMATKSCRVFTRLAIWFSSQYLTASYSILQSK